MRYHFFNAKFDVFVCWYQSFHRVLIYLIQINNKMIAVSSPFFDEAMARLRLFLTRSLWKGEGWLRRKQQAQQYQIIQRLDYMDNNNFQTLINLLSQNNNFNHALQHANQRYLIKSYKISEFNPIKVAQLYAIMQQKFYLRRTKPNQESWFENELRIFIWLLVGYLYVHGKTIEKMTQSNWDYFVPIFNHRSYTFFQYQSIALLKHSHKSPKWSLDEAQMLEEIIEFKNYRNKWNSIARQLYKRSNKKYYRNPKQCRQQWMNHLDPKKVHSEWTQSEDLILMTTVTSVGKKWSLVVKKLSNTRTEHMVKNRYKSLILNELKRSSQQSTNEIESYIISKLQGLTPLMKQQQVKIQHNQSRNPPQEKLQDQHIKTYKSSIRKSSNMSDAQFDDEQIDSPKMIELSESDFLNSPLPIPWGLCSSNLNEDDSV